ncbi:MAG TPA: hypothetical protein P5114_10105, partial [Hyphomicrobiaceae bacterium]|nr:hypothetical protein [Hyphomicrobiaceae bacterium]
PSGYEPDELPGCSTPRHHHRRSGNCHSRWRSGGFVGEAAMAQSSSKATAALAGGRDEGLIAQFARL